MLDSEIYFQPRYFILELRVILDAHLVVDRFIKVLNENVANTRAAERRVTLGPHDPARLVLDSREVHRVKGALGCRIKR